MVTALTYVNDSRNVYYMMEIKNNSYVYQNQMNQLVFWFKSLTSNNVNSMLALLSAKESCDYKLAKILRYQ